MKKRYRQWISLILLLCLCLMNACGNAEETLTETDLENEESTTDESEESDESTEEDEEDEESEAEPASGGTLITSMVMLDDYNPLLVTDENAAQVLNLIFCPLIDFDESGQAHAAIATSWTLSDDNLTATITLDEDACWQNGNAITAADVVYSIEVLMDADASYYKECVSNIDSVSALSNTKVQIEFEEASPLNLLCLYFPIISESYYSSSGHETEPMGAGPYMLKEYVTMEKFVLEINPYYYGSTPYIETIEILLTRSDARLDSFDQKVINLVYYEDISWSQYMNQSNVTLHLYGTSELEMLVFNVDTLSTDERQGIAYALDAKEILRVTNVEKGDVTEVPISPLRWYAPENPSRFGQNTSKTLELIDVTEMDTLILLVNKSSTLEVTIAEEVAAQLEEAGLSVEISSLSSKKYKAALKSGEFDIAVYTIESDTDLDLTTFLGQGTYNYAGYSSKTMKSLISAISSQTEEDQIHQAFIDVGEQLSEDMPYYCLFFKKQAVMTGKGVMGSLTPTEHNVFRGIENLYMLTTDDVEEETDEAEETEETEDEEEDEA